MEWDGVGVLWSRMCADRYGHSKSDLLERRDKVISLVGIPIGEISRFGHQVDLKQDIWILGIFSQLLREGRQSESVFDRQSCHGAEWMKSR